MSIQIKNKGEIKKYKPHKSSFFKMPARGVIVLLFLTVVIFDIVFSEYYLGWLPAVVLMYIEKNSLFVKYHSTQLLFLQLFKGIAIFILNFLVIIFEWSYYIGDFTTNSFEISVVGYIDIFIFIIWFAFFIIQFLYASNYKEFSSSTIRKIIYKFIKTDPNYKSIYNRTPYERY